MRTVEDILDSKARPFNFIEPDALVFDALQLMNSVNLSYLVVMHGTTFHGIFSERDYSRNVILKGLHSNTTTVKEVMSVALPQIGLHDSVEHSMNMLNTHKTRYLVVMHEGHFRGVVTINDVLREAIANKELVFDDAALQQATESQDKIY
jgi:signal-transduction protein with cAMP-binding, CBS, and nucleotidyltransferase domain